MTAAACSEPEQLRRTLEAGRLYVTDRGYEKFALFRGILDAKSSFIARVKDNLTYLDSAMSSLEFCRKMMQWQRVTAIDLP